MTSNPLKSVACIGFSMKTFTEVSTQLQQQFNLHHYKTLDEFYSAVKMNEKTFDAIIAEGELASPFGIKLKQSLDLAGFSDIPFSLIMQQLEMLSVKNVMEQGVAEVFIQPISAERIGRKLHYLVDKPVIHTRVQQQPVVHDYKVPFSKRLFDIVLSTIGLILLSPLFLIIAILLKLESKGPIFYYALRVGTGYKTFKFYKFRSMFVGADAKLSQLKHLNQYAVNAAPKAAPKQKCADCEQANVQCKSSLYADDKMWCEKLYKASQALNAEQAFVKIANDPRVTRVGKFIRNTSIDELPQLWNVLIGDMSIVGNRPLPLYEAEKLTTDKYALRFIAPAGITGLWQVSKRGKGDMSEDERISLDNDYAKSFGLWFDIKLILRTIPALFQKENV